MRHCPARPIDFFDDLARIRRVLLVQVALVPAWIAIVIVAREFMVAGLRSVAAGEGLRPLVLEPAMTLLSMTRDGAGSATGCRSRPVCCTRSPACC